MNKSVFTALCLVLVNGVATALPAEPNDRKRFLSPAEVARVVDESPVAYRITGMEGLEDVNAANILDKLFPLSVRPITYPVRVQKEDGSTEITEMLLPPEGKTILDEAEAHFGAGRFPEAILDYQRVIDRFPDCYLAYAHLGDSYFRMKQYDKALKYFDLAICLNPCDHRTFVYRADALMELGRPEEARVAFIHSLSLCPRYWLALANLRHFAATLGVEVRTSLFQPEAFVRPEPNGIAVYVGDEQSRKVWLVYALVKAIWLGEPSHRQEMLGDAAYRWSSVEETEALLNLISVYQSSKREGRVQPDPRLDLLAQIAEAGDLTNFILYEIASRMCPYITLTLPEDGRESLRAFIAKYVVVSLPDQPAGAEKQIVAALTALPLDSDRPARPMEVADSSPGSNSRPPEERPPLRTELEAVYARYLQAIRNEDAGMLCSVLTPARIRDLKQTFELNGMAFPDEYFKAFQKYSPRLPPLDTFRHIGVTQGDQYGNLIYVGDMNGYLRKTDSVQRFLIIQFERTPDGWKYAAMIDPPVDIVPDLEERLAEGRLDFLRFKPFRPERIELRP